MSRAAAIATRPHLRRDAAANRQHLIDAAWQVFADRGLDASVEEIARVAGVGVGTLYRRFSTKDALVAALVQDVLDAMLAFAEDAAEQPDGGGLERYLEAASAYQAEHSGCLPRLWNTDVDNPPIHRLRTTVGGLLEDAKRHGRVRADLTSTDLTVIMWSIRGVIETTRAVAPEAWRRHLGIVLAGMRPAEQPLAHRPLSRPQVDKIIAGD